MSAAGMLCFVKYFGLIIGHKVVEENKVWQLYIKLRKIIDINTSPRFVRSDVYDLERLITEHHALYIELFGSLKPKFHNMLHYPRLMLENGPLIHIWSMRYEPKHRELKRTANATSCTKNILRTLLIKQRLMMSYYAYYTDIGNEIVIGPKNDNDVIDVIFANSKDIKDIQIIKYVEVMGYKYRKDTIILCEIDEDNGPQFGKIF